MYFPISKQVNPGMENCLPAVDGRRWSCRFCGNHLVFGGSDYQTRCLYSAMLCLLEISNPIKVHDNVKNLQLDKKKQEKKTKSQGKQQMCIFLI